MSQEYGVVTAPDTVRIERLLPGSIDRVWAYLTEPDKRATWFAGGAADLRVGGEIALAFHNDRLTEGDDPTPPQYKQEGGAMTMTAHVTACEPPRLLAFTWDDGSHEKSEVRFELTARAGKVHLVLIHQRLRNRDQVLMVSGGWHTHLDILAARLEGRDPPKFWRTYTRLEGEYRQRMAGA